MTELEYRKLLREKLSYFPGPYTVLRSFFYQKEVDKDQVDDWFEGWLNQGLITINQTNPDNVDISDAF